jgi:uncharacterized protein YneF (UPF0154 family)
MIVTEMELALGLLVTLIVGIALGQYLRIKVYFKKPGKEEKQ